MPTLEAQIANLADEIAYNNHDVDDGLRSGFIMLEQLDEVSIFGRHRAEVCAHYSGLNDRRMISETVRRIINTLILDLVVTTASIPTTATYARQWWCAVPRHWRFSAWCCWMNTMNSSGSCVSICNGITRSRA